MTVLNRLSVLLHAFKSAVSDKKAAGLPCRV